jgi:fatty acid desaturase
VTVSDRLIGLLWANINYHVEHHIYPGVPFVNLPRLAALLDNKPYLRDRWLLARMFARRPVTTCAEPRRAA